MVNLEHGCFHVKDQGLGWNASNNSPQILPGSPSLDNSSNTTTDGEIDTINAGDAICFRNLLPRLSGLRKRYRLQQRCFKAEQHRNLLKHTKKVGNGLVASLYIEPSI